MTLRVGEIGKILRVNTNYNLSANTELTLEFTKPDGTVVTKTKTLDGVSAPGIDVTDPITGDVFLANEYMQYSFASGDLDQSGQWYVEAKYTDATPKFFIGAPAQFAVLE